MIEERLYFPNFPMNNFFDDNFEEAENFFWEGDTSRRFF